MCVFSIVVLKLTFNSYYKLDRGARVPLVRMRDLGFSSSSRFLKMRLGFKQRRPKEKIVGSVY